MLPDTGRVWKVGDGKQRAERRCQDSRYPCSSDLLADIRNHLSSLD